MDVQTPKVKFMACGPILGLMAVGSLLMIFNGFMKFFAGKIIFSAGDSIVGCLLAFKVYRLVRVPVLAFNDEAIKICCRSLSPVKMINKSDILCIKKKLFSGYRMILTNQKTINLPLGLLYVSDRDQVISTINDIIDNSRNKIAVTTNPSDGDHQKDSWF